MSATLTVRLFARARDLAGAETVTLPLPTPPTIATLRTSLAEMYPTLAKLTPHLHFAKGTDYVPETHPLESGDEIVAFPPVSGG